MVAAFNDFRDSALNTGWRRINSRRAIGAAVIGFAAVRISVFFASASISLFPASFD
jgi:hypothetical protein